MTELKEMFDQLKGIKTYVDDRVKEGDAFTKAESKRVTDLVEKIQGQIADTNKKLAAKYSTDTIGKFRVPDGRLAGMTPLDLRILRTVLQDRLNAGIPVRNSLYEGIVEARKNMRSILTPDSILEWGDIAMRRRAATIGPGGSTFHPAMGEFRDTVDGWTRQMLDVYNKALDSTTVGAGDELVPTLEAAELWLDVNLETLVLAVLPQTPMSSNPMQIPRQFGDVNWYPVDENVQVTTTDLTTGRISLQAYALKAGVPFSDELEEDAVVNLVAEIRSGLARNAAQVIDDVLINGDTTTLNNINSDGTTIAKNTAAKAHWLLGFDGLRHLPLVDNTAQRTDANAAVALSHFNTNLLGRMGKYGVARRRGEVVFISDPRTSAAVMGLASLVGQNAFDTRSTLSAGEVMPIFAVPFIRSDQMRQTDTDGLFTGTAGATTNTFGHILAVNTTQWRVGFRRQITMETQREAGKGQTTLYISFRIALSERTGTRSTATHTALVFDITGT